MGYIKFALDEPGWFTVAFFGADVPTETATAPPYLALIDALDAMVDAGALPPGEPRRRRVAMLVSGARLRRTRAARTVASCQPP